MGQSRVAFLRTAVIAVFGGIGLGAGGEWLITRVRVQETRLAMLSEEDIGELLSFARGVRSGQRNTVLARSNGHAAEAMVLLRRKARLVGPILMDAVTGPDPQYNKLVLAAIQPGAQPSAIVLMFAADGGRLVHYSHPVEEITRRRTDYAPAVKRVLTPRRAFVESGTVGDDGIVYVDTKALKENPETIRVPDGEVAVGLRYADGTYSNFVPLVWLKDASSPEDSGVPGGPLARVP